MKGEIFRASPEKSSFRRPCLLKKHFRVLLLHFQLGEFLRLSDASTECFPLRNWYISTNEKSTKKANLLFWVKAYKILMDYFLQGNVSLRWYLLNAKHPIESSVGSNLVRFGGSFGFLRFGRFEVRFLGQKRGSVGSRFGFNGKIAHFLPSY